MACALASEGFWWTLLTYWSRWSQSPRILLVAMRGRTPSLCCCYKRALEDSWSWPSRLLMGGKFKSLLPQWSKMTALTEWCKQAVGKRKSKPKSVDKTDWKVHWCILNLKLSSWTVVNLLVSLPLAERVVARVILSSSLMTQLAFIPAATHLIKMEGVFLGILLSIVLTLEHLILPNYCMVG